jgi:Cation transporter/ATPase, N-terminus
MEEQRSPLEAFWERPLGDLLQQLQATPAGLTTDEAKRRLRRFGPNSLVQEERFVTLFSVFRPPRHHPAGGQRHISCAP